MLNQVFIYNIIQKTHQNSSKLSKKFKLNTMQYSQRFVSSINLPYFLTQFKQKCNRIMVPHLVEFKNFINQEDNNATVHPVITILVILFILYSIHAIYKGLFGITLENNQNNRIANSSESQQLRRQLNDLKKQLKGLYMSFGQLAKQFKNKKSNSNSLKILQDSSIQRNNDVNMLKLWKQFVPIYNNSIQNNKKLALYILQTQQEVLKQLKKFKKNNRLSSSSGRPSTTRSKTSDKKIFASQIIKQKKNHIQLNTFKQNFTKLSVIEINNDKDLNTIQSKSILQTSVLHLNNHKNDLNLVNNEQEIKVPQTPIIIRNTLVPPINLMKNVKPPLPKIPKQLPPKNNIQNDMNPNNQQSLIKRSQQNIFSYFKNDQQNITNQKVYKIDKPEIKPLITQRVHTIIEKNEKKTQKKAIQQPQQIQQSTKNQQIVSEALKNDQVRMPSFQSQDIGESQINPNLQIVKQIVAPPKLTNIRKPNPPSKSNTSRKAPPPPPRK